jgi:hypothetical protein
MPATIATLLLCFAANLRSMFFRVISIALFFGFAGTVLTAEEKPEAILAAVKKLSENKPWGVEAHVVAKDIDTNISGIINGKDFDLTIDTGDQVRRQIVIGDKGWLSDNDGDTWEISDANDRRFYYLVHTPIADTGQKFPPFEKVGIDKEGEDSVLHVRFKAPQKINYEGDRPNWWILLKDGQPESIQHYHGPAGFEGNLVIAKVDYIPVTEPNPVIPPPGNPHLQSAEDNQKTLLMAAMKKMEEGVWEVNGIATREKTVRIHGLLSGEDFDLTMESEDGHPLNRQIAIGDQAWAKPTGGKTWKKAQVSDRSIYSLAHTPILSAPWESDFKKVSEEQHAGVTWLHIRAKTIRNSHPESFSAPAFFSYKSQYWFALDGQGQPLYIARYEGVISSVSFNNVTTTVSNTATRCEFEYKAAKDKTIAAPEGTEPRRKH